MPQTKTKSSDLTILRLGLVDYEKCWQLQREIHEKVANGDASNTLIFVEHPSVYTAGRRTEITERPQDGTPVIDVDRGGRITWHGPGQIVGYPIVHLKNQSDVVGFVRNLENAIIEVLKEFNLVGISIAGRTGVWLKDETERKIAAIGVRVAKGVTMHGFALNVNPDLNNFNRIIACGLPDVVTTSMATELNREIKIPEIMEVLERKMIAALETVSDNRFANKVN